MDRYSALESDLLDLTGQTRLSQRFRALFTLKSLGTLEAIEIIGKALDAEKSALLGHELAYCLGQIGKPEALPSLMKVLHDRSNHPMVRHEAAEAIGAISDFTSIGDLQKYLNDEEENVSVRETCEIAIAKIQWEQKHPKDRSKYQTIDPAPSEQSTASEEEYSAIAMGTKLTNPTLPLFERYRAMFALRDDGTEQAVEQLALGFGDKSALFKHEIAYVFGQLSSPYSVPSLVKVLEDEGEDEMVRHEAAEALGGIATPDVLPYLQKYSKIGPEVVRQSCEVALDMYEFENSQELRYE